MYKLNVGRFILWLLNILKVIYIDTMEKCRLVHFFRDTEKIEDSDTLAGLDFAKLKIC